MAAAPTRQMRAASVLVAAAAAPVLAAAGDRYGVAAGVAGRDGAAPIAQACAAAGTGLAPAGERSATAIATGPTRHVRVAAPPLRVCSCAAGGETGFSARGVEIGAASAEVAHTGAVEIRAAAAAAAGAEFRAETATAPTRHIRGPSVAMPDAAAAAAGFASAAGSAAPAAAAGARPEAEEAAWDEGAASHAAMAAGPTRHMRIELAAPLSAAASATRAGVEVGGAETRDGAAVAAGAA